MTNATPSRDRARDPLTRRRPSRRRCFPPLAADERRVSCPTPARRRTVRPSRTSALTSVPNLKRHAHDCHHVQPMAPCRTPAAGRHDRGRRRARMESRPRRAAIPRGSSHGAEAADVGVRVRSTVRRFGPRADCDARQPSPSRKAISASASKATSKSAGTSPSSPRRAARGSFIGVVALEQDARDVGVGVRVDVRARRDAHDCRASTCWRRARARCCRAARASSRGGGGSSASPRWTARRAVLVPDHGEVVGERARLSSRRPARRRASWWPRCRARRAGYRHATSAQLGLDGRTSHRGARRRVRGGGDVRYK